MPGARAVAKLTRLDSSALIFLAVFAPLYSRTTNFASSLEKALPLLFIAMCTYIANDLDDIERDQTNHPARPLPSQQLTTAFAALLYFTSLSLALLTVGLFIPPHVAAWYYTTLVLAISYAYIVEWLPGLKAPYVACALSLPVLIVRAFYPREPRLRLLALVVFLLSLGRELCKDLVDRAGDRTSFMHDIRPSAVATFAFSVQIGALLLLMPTATTAPATVALTLMACILSVTILCWYKMARHEWSIYLMKVLLLAGLYFLL